MTDIFYAGMPDWLDALNLLAKGQLQPIQADWTAAPGSLRQILNKPLLAAVATSGSKDDIGLGKVDNTSDSAKPVSTLQSEALALKVDKQGLSKGSVGLDKVDNTSDANKPVSTAQAAALDLKADAAAIIARIGSGGATGLRNRLDNSGFAINQLVLTGNIGLAASGHGHDRWKAGATGCSYRVEDAQGARTLTITSGTLMQIVPASRLPPGVNTMVLSWFGTAKGRIAPGGFQDSGMTAAVTGGSSVVVEFSAGTLGYPQLEIGNVASPYGERDVAAELVNCTRYYRHSFNAGQGPTTAASPDALLSDTSTYAVDSLENNGKFTIEFPVEMIAPPTIRLYGYAGNVAGWACQGAIPSGSPQIALVAVSGISSKKFFIVPTIAGRQYNIMGHWSADVRL